LRKKPGALGNCGEELIHSKSHPDLDVAYNIVFKLGRDEKITGKNVQFLTGGGGPTEAINRIAGERRKWEGQSNGNAQRREEPASPPRVVVNGGTEKESTKGERGPSTLKRL